MIFWGRFCDRWCKADLRVIATVSHQDQAAIFCFATNFDFTIKRTWIVVGTVCSGLGMENLRILPSHLTITLLPAPPNVRFDAGPKKHLGCDVEDVMIV